MTTEQIDNLTKEQMRLALKSANKTIEKLFVDSRIYGLDLNTDYLVEKLAGTFGIFWLGDLRVNKKKFEIDEESDGDIQ